MGGENLPGGRDGQTESVERGGGAEPEEPMGQIARRHQVSEALIYRGREKFYEGGKAALSF